MVVDMVLEQPGCYPTLVWCSSSSQLGNEIAFVDKWLTRHVSDHSALNHRKNLASALPGVSSGECLAKSSERRLMWYHPEGSVLDLAKMPLGCWNSTGKRLLHFEGVGSEGQPISREWGCKYRGKESVSGVLAASDA